MTRSRENVLRTSRSFARRRSGWFSQQDQPCRESHEKRWSGERPSGSAVIDPRHARHLFDFRIQTRAIAPRKLTLEHHFAARDTDVYIVRVTDNVPHSAPDTLCKNVVGNVFLGRECRGCLGDYALHTIHQILAAFPHPMLVVPQDPGRLIRQLSSARAAPIGVTKIHQPRSHTSPGGKCC